MVDECLSLGLCGLDHVVSSDGKQSILCCFVGLRIVDCSVTVPDDVLIEVDACLCFQCLPCESVAESEFMYITDSEITILECSYSSCSLPCAVFCCLCDTLGL